MHWPLAATVSVYVPPAAGALAAQDASGAAIITPAAARTDPVSIATRLNRFIVISSHMPNRNVSVSDNTMLR
jgi:hypothetical protein